MKPKLLAKAIKELERKRDPRVWRVFKLEVYSDGIKAYIVDENGVAYSLDYNVKSNSWQ